LGSRLRNGSFVKSNPIKTIDIRFLHELFPQELMTYFTITAFKILCDIATKKEYWLIDFDEKNDLPSGYEQLDYESKDFMDGKLVQDFPIRGKGVYLRIRKRRWRHKTTGTIIKRDFSFIADGSKFTQELSDFLKDGSEYATRHHQQHSELLPGE
jgi:hypothetical protein